MKQVSLVGKGSLAKTVLRMLRIHREHGLSKQDVDSHMPVSSDYYNCGSTQVAMLEAERRRDEVFIEWSRRRGVIG